MRFILSLLRQAARYSASRIIRDILYPSITLALGYAIMRFLLRQL